MFLTVLNILMWFWIACGALWIIGKVFGALFREISNDVNRLPWVKRRRRKRMDEQARIAGELYAKTGHYS